MSGRYFLTYMRGEELVFASEVAAENPFQAQHRARSAMIRAHQATRADFASCRVRLTGLAEQPEGVRPFGLRKSFCPDEEMASTGGAG